MANKLSKDISGSVQEKRGMLYLVVSYKDTVTQKNKTKWLGLGLPAGSTKSLINKAVREAKNKFESEYKRFLDGYDDPTKYPLLQFLNDWLDRVHIHKIQESTYYGYKRRVSGKMAKYFDGKITLADCKPRLIHGFYDYLREDGDSEQTILHYHNLLHTAFEYAIRQEILEYNPMDRVERPQPKKFVGDFYSVDEVKTLLEHAKEDVIYIPIVLAVYCGLRRSEALGLSWSNIDFENDKIFILYHLSLPEVVEAIRDAGYPLPRSASHLRFASRVAGREHEGHSEVSRPQQYEYDCRYLFSPRRQRHGRGGDEARQAPCR